MSAQTLVERLQLCNGRFCECGSCVEAASRIEELERGYDYIIKELMATQAIWHEKNEFTAARAGGWNDALLHRAIPFVQQYRDGKGLFQITEGSTRSAASAAAKEGAASK